MHVLIDYKATTNSKQARASACIRHVTERVEQSLRPAVPQVEQHYGTSVPCGTVEQCFTVLTPALAVQCLVPELIK
jgi:hypothetical protein